jgi:serine/threonine-protein kinase
VAKTGRAGGKGYARGGRHSRRPHRRSPAGITARWRRAAAGAAALALPLTAITLTAAPASAAVRYLVTHTIPVGGTLWGVAVDSATHTACVANGQTRAVSVIDEASDTVTRTIPAGTSTYGLALDPAARVAYLTGCFSGEVSVLDLVTGTVTARVHAAGVTSGGREFLGDFYVVQPCR